MNPSLLNPGPLQYLKVATINCQGLIPFKELGSDHPSLDITKMAELNSYLDVKSNKVELKCSGEILAATLTLMMAKS